MMRIIALAMMLSLGSFQLAVAGQTMEVVDVAEVAGSAESVAAVQVVGPVVTQPLVADDGCGISGENRMSDLCAQWKAADAARDGANWTILALAISTAINLLTLVFLMLNFQETRKSADAAWASASYSQQTLHSDRAWVTCSAPKIEHKGSIFKVSVVWTNFGRSPALDLVYGVDIHTRHKDDFFIARRSPATAERGRTVGAGEVVNARDIDVPISLISAMSSKNEAYFIVGWVQYKDVFNSQAIRETHFCYKIQFIEIGTSVAIESVPYGPFNDII